VLNLLQTWLILGVPLLAGSVYLFIGRNKTLARIGYVGLFALVLVLMFVPDAAGPGRAISVGLVGAVAFTFVATGRGTQVDDEFVEHHEDRRRFTTADADAQG
jgi:hypothetical protein